MKAKNILVRCCLPPLTTSSCGHGHSLPSHPCLSPRLFHCLRDLRQPPTSLSTPCGCLTSLIRHFLHGTSVTWEDSHVTIGIKHILRPCWRIVCDAERLLPAYASRQACLNRRQRLLTAALRQQPSRATHVLVTIPVSVVASTGASVCGLVLATTAWTAVGGDVAERDVGPRHRLPRLSLL